MWANLSIEEKKAMAAEVRAATGESMYCSLKALSLCDFDVQSAIVWFKSHYFDSHMFKRDR